MKITELLTKEEEQAIVRAISSAEELTDGEIRVHIEEKILTESAYHRAVEVFNALKMHLTQKRTGVLFYINATEKALVILGDEGINACVPQLFWQNIHREMLHLFKQEQYAHAICQAIATAGQELAYFFPKTQYNENELPNEISTQADIPA